MKVLSTILISAALLASGGPRSWAADLVELMAKRQVEAVVAGSDIQSVDIRLRPTVPVSAAAPLHVDIVAGTFFESRNGAQQNMVGTVSRSVDLTSKEWVEVTMAAACASRARDIPDSSNQFAVRRLPEQAELAKAAKVLAAANAPYAVIQAAIWIISDNANYDDLGELVETTTYNPSGGTRVIGQDEAARAMRVLNDAGIDIRRKRIWADRRQIASGVSDPALKTWLGGR